MRNTPTVWRSALTIGLSATLVWSFGIAFSLAPVQAQSTLGGHDFTLASLGGRDVLLTWTGGVAQNSYVLQRLGPTSGQVGSFVPGSATAVSSTVPAADPYGCFQLAALNLNGGVVARSDLLCIVFGFSSGTVPQNFRLSLHESAFATGVWTSVPNATAHAFVALGTDRIQAVFGIGQLAAADNTGGTLTCYAVAAFSASGVVGVTEAICAFPGFAFFDTNATPFPTLTPTPATGTPTATPTVTLTGTQATGTPTSTLTRTLTGTVPAGSTMTPTPTFTQTSAPGTGTATLTPFGTPSVLQQQPLFSVGPNGPTGCDPADILAIPGTTGVSCSGTGSPSIVITCAALTFAADCSGTGSVGPPSNNDVKGLSFGEALGAETYYFSADTNALGCLGSAVRGQVAAHHPDGSEYERVNAASIGCTGTNTVFAPAPTLGLKEGQIPEPPNDDDELDDMSYPVGTQPYFTLAPGSPTLARIGATGGDILTTPVFGQGAVIAVNHSALGLQQNDAIDAICMFAPPSVGGVFFSLAPGSPSLSQNGFSAADVLTAGPSLAFQAQQFGLLSTDNMDGLKCRGSAGVATSTTTVSPTRTPTGQPTASASPTGNTSATPTVTRTFTPVPTATGEPVATQTSMVRSAQAPTPASIR